MIPLKAERRLRAFKIDCQMKHVGSGILFQTCCSVLKMQTLQAASHGDDDDDGSINLRTLGLGRFG